MKQALYDDGLVTLDADGLTIRRYYFPMATSKRIPYTRIKGVQERHMELLTGKGRLWGQGTFGTGYRWIRADHRRRRPSSSTWASGSDQ
jgi:hypothetical protein